MKKSISFFVIALNTIFAHAQTDVDALRYTIDDITGTARYRSMSGAFGALGGDISALNINPASSSVLDYYHISVTMGDFGNENNSTYYGNTENVKGDVFRANQLGFVNVFQINEGSVNKIAFGVNYERSNSFENSVYSKGFNPNNSIADYFLSYANGTPFSAFTKTPLLDQSYAEQQAFFGYERWIVTPKSETDSNTEYYTNVPAGEGYSQLHVLSSRGDDRKWTFNLSTDLQNKLYLGMSLNYLYNYFSQTQEFTETNKNHNPNNKDISKIYFKNELYTTGSGVSVQFGGIYKVTDHFRLGLAFNTPTWYVLYDELTQTVNTTTIDDKGVLDNHTRETNAVSEPVVTNKFPEYNLQTPWKVSGSTAFVIGKKCLLSFDAIYRDFGSTILGPTTDEYFRYINKGMNAELGGAMELRTGVEYRMNALSFRGGYRHEQSPYKNSNEIGALNGFSLGIGLSSKAAKFDVAYATSRRTSNQPFYTQGFTDSASVENIRRNIVFTLTIVGR